MFRSLRFVEFKIYISLKHHLISPISQVVLQNSKFTYLSNVMLSNSYFTYVLQNSKFTYLSNQQNAIIRELEFCRIQNLHISQTVALICDCGVCFVEFKIYISLKLDCKNIIIPLVLQNSKFTYLSNPLEQCFQLLGFCRIQNLHISQTSK